MRVLEGLPHAAQGEWAENASGWVHDLQGELERA
jgi:hypothetical protein